MLDVNSTSVTAGSTAEQPSARKEEKHAALVLCHTFITIIIVIEIMGPIVSKSLSFCRSLVVIFLSTLATHENLHSYFSDCLLLCNDTMKYEMCKYVFVARLVLSKIMTD